METEELVEKAPFAVNLGTAPTVVILALAAYGAGTLGTQAGVVVTAFMRKRKAKKATPESPETTTE